ncbi:MAG TPA: M3 family metallopeptidase, partial [Bryobacteraceae bacterium]|nr:M3 family metallopeptidase [Bryobacteraceae bacterium]
MAANPLLACEYRIPFDQVKPEHVEPAIDQLLADAHKRLDDIIRCPAPRTYANTMQALDDLTIQLDYAMNITRHLEGVATTPELRAAYNAVQPKVAAFYSSLPLNEGLWNAINQYARSEEAKTLSGARARFLKKTIDTFRRHGAELDPAGKKRLQEIDVELAQLTTKFSENVLDATNAFEIVVTDESRLAGLPPIAIAAARQSAQAKGLEGWRFTLHQPSYIAAMTYLDDEGIRRDLYHAYNTRSSGGPFDNRELIVRILRLRKEKAALLGYRDFADLVLEDRMAHNGDQAQAFLEQLREKTQAHFERENRELAEFAGRPLNAWDIGYFAEKQRKALYDFDEEALRPYFPLDRVVAGMFEIFGRVFGIRVIEKSGVPVWDPAVRYYVIEDEGGAMIGGFYAD